VKDEEQNYVNLMEFLSLKPYFWVYFCVCLGLRKEISWEFDEIDCSRLDLSLKKHFFEILKVENNENNESEMLNTFLLLDSSMY
jgi:hypothetical protein